MSGTKVEHKWTTFFKFYSEQNGDRPTRIGLFETVDGITNDYWIEDGLPFKGIDADLENGMPVVEIMLEGLTHLVRNVRQITATYSLNGSEEGMNIISSNGATTIVRFEDT